ncbi:hypothetical protein DID88_007272 [Monilinia fructigena]|uniref:Uncharacterized protein n=1 Tax=Monilinia fructigena TaxID=38457 RepID=A0A395J8I1_9HELO|nr:hypothetical protein DID88_007272 [Monilinia fructigena]
MASKERKVERVLTKLYLITISITSKHLLGYLKSRRISLFLLHDALQPESTNGKTSTSLRRKYLCLVKFSALQISYSSDLKSSKKRSHFILTGSTVARALVTFAASPPTQRPDWRIHHIVTKRGKLELSQPISFSKPYIDLVGQTERQTVTNKTLFKKSEKEAKFPRKKFNSRLFLSLF